MPKGFLDAIREANRWYFEAWKAAGALMPGRRAKYSGDINPYSNFVFMARILGVEVQEGFRNYVAIKLARHLMESGDFADESELDNDQDGGNYFFLSAGWRRMTAQERLQAMLECGPWVSVGTLEALGVDVRALLEGDRG